MNTDYYAVPELAASGSYLQLSDTRLGSDSGSRSDTITIPTIRLAIALSLLFHAVMLWGPWLKELHLYPSLETAERGKSGGSLVVQLNPPTPPASPAASAVAPSTSNPAPETANAPSAAPAPAHEPVPRTRNPQAATPRLAHPHVERQQVARATSPSTVPREPSATPKTAAPAPPSPAQPAPPDSSPARQPAEKDLASYIEARRRARGESDEVAFAETAPAAPRAPTERERENQAVATRLGLNTTPTFGDDPKSGGGVFQIQRMGYDDADFVFYGWNKEIKRNSRQLIQTRKGDNSDIRIAVIRRMIGIIRESESGDFIWISQRLGREVTLSAAPQDNAGLEDFLMKEFFGTQDKAQSRTE